MQPGTKYDGYKRDVGLTQSLTLTNLDTASALVRDVGAVVAVALAPVRARLRKAPCALEAGGRSEWSVVEWRED